MTLFSKLQLITVLAAWTLSVQAVEFTHFKLKKSPEVLLKSSNNQRVSSRATPDIPIIPIISELQSLLGNKYNALGENETKDLLENYDLGGGVLNFSGFTWHKPMLNYNISANRELAPELTSDKWIVHDNFTIQIDALTFLSNLKQKDIIDITEKQLQAFVGLSFNRTYHYYHFANTYLDGLTADYSKLFLSFSKFSPKNFDKISPYEVLKKEDTFHFSTGAGLKIPTNGGVLGAGVSLSTTSHTVIQVHKVGKDDFTQDQSYLKINVLKEKLKSSAGKLSLEYDFFNILNLTLLSLEFQYEYKKTDANYLAFAKNEWKGIQNNKLQMTELTEVLKGKTKIDQLVPYLVSKEQREKEDYNSKFSFLLLGSMKKRAMEQIKIIKGNVEKVFFKSYSRSVSYIQNFISRLFNIFVRRIFDFDTSISNISELKKELQIEYEHMKNFDPMVVDTEKKFSLKIIYAYSINKTHRWYHYSRLKAAKRYANDLSILKSEIKDKIKRKELRGPLRGTTEIELGEVSILKFLQKDEQKIENNIISLCDLTYREKKDILKGKTPADTPRTRCYKRIAKRYIEFKTTYTTTKQINLKKLKSFIGAYIQKTSKLSDLKDLFGDNIFTHGSFKATTRKGKSYQTFYSSGKFEGLGVIDQYRQE